MNDISVSPRVDWPSGDCYPVIATKLLPDELSRRSGSNLFRDRDDLDWFIGIVIPSSEIGPILVMGHDNNPQNLTVFYVDAAVAASLGLVKQIIVEIFDLAESEISWSRTAP